MEMNQPLARVLKSLSMVDERTVEIVFHDHVIVNNEDVAEVYRNLDTLTAGKRLKKLLIIGQHVDISTETRFLIVKENNLRKEHIIAEAVVVHSVAQKLKTNFYIMFLRKIYPTQFFTSVDAAKEWLSQY